MTCHQIEHLIQKSLDEPLSSAERNSLDAHCASCRECQGLSAEYTVLSQSARLWTMRSGSKTLPTDQFTAQVLAALDSREELAMPSHRWRLLAVMAALIILAVLSTLAAPWVSVLRGPHVDWTLPPPVILVKWPEALSAGIAAGWTAAGDLIPLRLAITLVLFTLPVNAWLYLKVQGQARRRA